jgi:hypothetical protein
MTPSLRHHHVKQVKAASAAALRRSWRRGLIKLVNDTSDLYWRLQIYVELVEIVRANRAVVRPPVFFHWLHDNYVIAICLGIRRMCEVGSDSISLGRLLREIALRPELVSRTSYRALRRRRRGLRTKSSDFEFNLRLGPRVRYLPRKVVRRDISQVNQADARIRRFVNKRVAHRAPLNQVRKLPTLEQVEDALDVIDSIIVKYDALISGGGLSTTWAPLLDC